MRHRSICCMFAWVLAVAIACTGSAQDNSPRTVTINTLGYYKLGDQAGGVMTPVTIRLARSTTGRMRLGFFEDEIDGFGEMWRAAAWVSNVIAIDLSGTDPNGVQILFERSGRVDGPSAGGLTTIGILAALRGDEVRNDAAMTGTINPDGTIGPVGGIPHKIDGAAKAGMKQVLIPLGQRTDFDQNLQQDVDLVRRGRDLGVEVTAVGDIYQAYELMTGSVLPRPAPAAAPRLDPEIYDRMSLKTDEWVLRFKDFQTKYEQIPEKYRSEYCDGLVASAVDSVGNIKRLKQEGEVPMAFREALRASLLTAIAVEIANTIWVDEVRGREKAKEYALRFAKIDQKIEIAVKRLKQYKPKTLGEAGVLIFAYTSATEAIAYRAAAGAILEDKFDFPSEAPGADVELENILVAVYAMQVAALNCEHIRDLLEVAGDLQGREVGEPDQLAEVADFLRRAAEANLNQFEQVVVAENARNANTSFNVMKAVTMQRDESYLAARFGLDAAVPTLRQLVGVGDALPYAELGAAIFTYNQSAILMTTHYSLGISYGDSGDVAGVAREGAMQFMLDFAQDQARRNIQLLKDNDVDPAATIFECQIGSILRGRELSDRLESLSWLWEANIQARVLAHAGGFASPD